MDSNAFSSIVRLNIGGYEFLTTVGTLTNREPQSMLSAMFSGRHTVYKDPEKGFVFIDRDGKHFRHILNWLRDGVAPIPNLSDLERVELLREAEYYQLLGLVEMINEVLSKKKDVPMDTDLTRTDIIRCIQSRSTTCFNLRGVDLSGLDLSRLDLSSVNFNYAILKNVLFSGAALTRALFVEANLRSDLFNASLEGANLEGANLKGANLSNANLKGANLQCADLRDVQHLEGANLEGANLLGAIR